MSLGKWTKKADKENTEMMGVKDSKWLEIHNRNETLWVAEDLVEETPKKWLKIVDEIETPDGIFNLETKTGSSSNLNEKSQELRNLPWIIVND